MHRWIPAGACLERQERRQPQRLQCRLQKCAWCLKQVSSVCFRCIEIRAPLSAADSKISACTPKLIDRKTTSLAARWRRQAHPSSAQQDASWVIAAQGAVRLRQRRRPSPRRHGGYRVSRRPSTRLCAYPTASLTDNETCSTLWPNSGLQKVSRLFLCLEK